MRCRYCKDDTSFKELQFECSPSGKPWLVSEQGKDGKGDQLHFNLTHTDRLLGMLCNSNLLGGAWWTRIFVIYLRYESASYMVPDCKGFKAGQHEFFQNEQIVFELSDIRKLSQVTCRSN